MPSSSRGLPRVIAAGAVALACLLAGCGGGSSTSSSTASKSGPAPVKLNGKSAAIGLSSPAMGNRGALPSAYTCHGRDTWPTLEWSSVPAGTAELDIFVLQLAGNAKQKTSVQWALSGLSPSLRKITTGKLPGGAVVGHDSGGKSGYALCPPKGRATNFAFLLLALPKRLGRRPGFESTSLLNTLIASEPPFGAIYATYKPA